MHQNPRMGWDMLRRVETEPSFLENLPDCTHVLPSATSCRRTRLKPSWGKALSARSFHSGQFSCKYSWAETAQDPKSKVLGRSWREHETQLHSTLLNAPELDRPRWTPNCTVASGESCDSMDPQQAIQSVLCLLMCIFTEWPLSVIPRSLERVNIGKSQ